MATAVHTTLYVHQERRPQVHLEHWKCECIRQFLAFPDRHMLLTETAFIYLYFPYLYFKHYFRILYLHLYCNDTVF